jgi:hypothetical protein
MVQFIRFYGMQSRQVLFPAESQIESFLTNLSVHGQVTAAIQNQAMNALMYPDTPALNHALESRIHAMSPGKQINVPVVLTRDKVAAVISLLDGTT